MAPHAVIDLFTDEAIEDPVFDAVHLLETRSHRPKIEALRRARFDRAVCLDNDIIAVADPSDMFDLLDRFEVIGVHDNNRNSRNARRLAGGPIPASFPSINSGVLGVRKSARTQALLRAWETRMAAHGHRVDQPALRAVLWEGDVRLGVLPIEYNLMVHDQLWTMTHNQAAPRLLHVRELTALGRPEGDPLAPYELSETFSSAWRTRLHWLLAGDASLSEKGAEVAAAARAFPTWRVKLRSRVFGLARHGPRFFIERARRARASAREDARKEDARKEDGRR
ncbi:MAG: putative nucleotide-diphospho-sugar transferase [Pseudomonadota bacterium]